MLIETITFPEDLKVFEDKKTHARTIAFPFDFPSKHNGVLMVTRLNRFDWQPSQDIASIIINFKDYEDSTVS